MIQLANDPSARKSSRPNAQGEKQPVAPQLRRPGHAWPFLSPHANRVDRPAGQRNPSSDSGS